MNTRGVMRGCVSIGACAAMISAASVWALVNATASAERDPFHFASIMLENSRAHAAGTVTVLADPVAEQLPQHNLPGGPNLPDLFALPPACLRACA